jgi:hypothetical protein
VQITCGTTAAQDAELVAIDVQFEAGGVVV